jgi:hypothetical protein
LVLLLPPPPPLPASVELDMGCPVVIGSILFFELGSVVVFWAAELSSVEVGSSIESALSD